jgi:hypothetical protein
VPKFLSLWERCKYRGSAGTKAVRAVLFCTTYLHIKTSPKFLSLWERCRYHGCAGTKAVRVLCGML